MGAEQSSNGACVASTANSSSYSTITFVTLVKTVWYKRNQKKTDNRSKTIFLYTIIIFTQEKILRSSSTQLVIF